MVASLTRQAEQQQQQTDVWEMAAEQEEEWEEEEGVRLALPESASKFRRRLCRQSGQMARRRRV